jgi:hypothetical protein
MSCKPFTFDSDYVAAQVGAGEDDDGEKLSDEEAKMVGEMLSTETLGRGRPKALCYEDILLMVVRHPVMDEDVLVMAVKFIHHKGADNKPKPYVLSRYNLRTLSLTFAGPYFSSHRLEG